MEYHGVKLGLTPKIQIIHDHQESENSNTKKYRSYRAEQCKLVEYTNILKPLPVKRYSFYLYRKWLLSILAFNQLGAKHFKNEIIYYNSNRRKIQISRITNKQKGLVWL